MTSLTAWSGDGSGHIGTMVVPALLRALNGEYTRPDAPNRGFQLVPSPDYLPEVDAFFHAAARPCWEDFGYLAAVQPLLADPARVGQANLSEIRTLLTWCVRRERFVTGHWRGVLANGLVFAILERLHTLKQDALA